MLRIAVCIKPVPESTKVSVDPVTKLVKRDACENIINALDRNALELTAKLKQTRDCEVTIITMAPPFAQKQLRKALSRGGDKAVLLSDRAFGGGDTFATSYVLASAIKKLGGFDIIIMGDMSSDAGTMHVPPQVAEWLGIDHVHNVSSIDPGETSVVIESEGANTHYVWEADYPVLVSVNRKASAPKAAGVNQTVAARTKEFITLSLANFPEIDKSMIGLAGSPTQFGAIYPIENNKECVIVEDNGVAVASQILAVLEKAGIQA
jgi:electron transfer flavoprotein beta subunit